MEEIERSMETYIELEKAQSLVLDHVYPVKTEKLKLKEAYQRVLAGDVHSLSALPPFDRSPLDGYAYWTETNNTAPIRLKVVCEIPAGTWSEQRIGVGEAAKIFTGAPIPVGTNCIVRWEDTEVDGDEVIINFPVAPGANIVPRGDEIKEGEKLLLSGTLLTPAAIGLLAAVGVEFVEVYRRPLVGLLATGSELKEVGSTLAPGQIFNSNTYTLRGLIQNNLCDVKLIPLVPDLLPETLTALQNLEDCHLVISTGGASAGEYDLMRLALEKHDCQLLFWKINMKPGTPVAVALKEKKLFFSLSGNPAAAMVTFELLVRPALRKLAGLSLVMEDGFMVKMAGGFGKSGRQRRFLRAKIIFRDGEIWAYPPIAQGSSVLLSMIGSQLLIDVPAGHGVVKEGEYLKAHWTGNGEEVL